MKPIIYDTETTGLPDWKEPSESPQQPHLVEIAALLFDGAAEVDRFHAIVRPDGWDIPEEVAKIHGITMERALDEGIPEPEAVASFLATHARADMRVAHNESFDARILRIALKRYGHGASGWDMLTQDERDAIADQFKAAPAYCTCTAAKPLMKLPPTEKMLANPRFRNSYKQPNLQEAHQHFLGQTFEGAHGALADAEACARVYFALTAAPVAA
jgi:DNA polymerase III epsilon subunit-like protein